jgi:hypothetical protein
MQTFVPYDDYYKIGRSLDNKRLGKQRVEAMQILNCLYKPNRWQNHPAVRMWRGYHEALKHYQNWIMMAWMERGFKNTMAWAKTRTTFEDFERPWWFGNEDIHRSHRLMLVYKSIGEYLQKEKIDTFNWYAKQGWHEEYIKHVDNFEGYIWPVELKGGYKPKEKLIIPQELLDGI